MGGELIVKHAFNDQNPVTKKKYLMIQQKNFFTEVRWPIIMQMI